MREKYEELLNEVGEISRKSCHLAEILQGYCDSKDGEKVSSSMLSDFFGEIKDSQQKIINLIDEKSTNIGYEFYLKHLQN